MDLKDLVVGGESALPQMSTTTYSSKDSGSLPTFTLTTNTAVKSGASFLLSILGMYYLAVGKKESDLQKLLIGGALSIVALFLF